MTTTENAVERLVEESVDHILNDKPILALAKKGRPREKVESEKQDRIRESWRKASSNYYWRNRDRILEKARKGGEN